MGLFDVMFRKPKESTAKKEVAIEESFIESADKAALLVSQSVESGDIAKLYGHLHGGSHRLAIEGTRNGVEYRLVAADYVKFRPVRILDL